MKIALLGYGKMGHMIADIAKKRQHTIVVTIDPFASDACVKTSSHKEIVDAIVNAGAEGIIEFTHPSSVLENIKALIPTKIPLVVGTTGWKDSLPEIEKLVHEYKSHLIHSANFSLGVNLFYQVVAQATRLLTHFEEYDIAVLEAHHNKKADSPSGTALEIAQQILQNNPRKTKLVTDAFNRPPKPEELHVASVRVGSVPGTHTVIFDSVPDTIELTHTARSREGFALGAVCALEWLKSATDNKKPVGIYTMNDVLAEL